MLAESFSVMSLLSKYTSEKKVRLPKLTLINAGISLDGTKLLLSSVLFLILSLVAQHSLVQFNSSASNERKSQSGSGK